MRKLTLFAALAVTVAAFAVPTVASAIWTQNHVDIPAHTNPAVHGTGNFAFTSSFGGVNCSSNVTGTITLTGGSTTGSFNELNPVVANCAVTRGLAGCTITEIHRTGLPWTVHANATSATVTTVHIDYTVHGFLCPTNVTIYGDVTLTPDPNKSTINSLTFSGTMASNVGPTVTASGTITATAADAGKYGWT